MKTLLQQFSLPVDTIARRRQNLFPATRQELQEQLDARQCDRRTSRRSNRHLYRRGDVEKPVSRAISSNSCH